MNDSAVLRLRIQKRLRPLYWAAFFNGLVFWYVVDKLLTTRIGVSTSLLGIMLAVMAIVTVAGEVPSGILADRWSRKGVLIIALLCLGASTLFGLFARSPWHYWGLCICWGVYAAMYSGTYEAMVYDVILEESGDETSYERLFGRVGQFESAALVIGSLVGGLFLATNSLRWPFAMSLLSTVLALICIMRFREPLVHKSHDAIHITKHIRDTFRAVVGSRELIHYFAISLFLGVTLRVYWEYTQFWYIQLGLPKSVFGIAAALLLATIWLRSFIANRLSIQRNLVLFICLGMAVGFGLLLTIANPWVAVAASFGAMVCNQLAWLALNTLQQDLLPSRLRAGATSVFNSLGNVAFVPIGIIFGYLALDGGITRAAWVPVVIMLCSATTAYSAMRLHRHTVE